jgi:hypothetical protein
MAKSRLASPSHPSQIQAPAQMEFAQPYAGQAGVHDAVNLKSSPASTHLRSTACPRIAAAATKTREQKAVISIILLVYFI